MTKIIANGNTYNVKGDLRKVGFEWNSKNKIWTTESFDKDAWENKYCKPSWNGRKQAGLCKEITFEEITE